MSTHRFEYDAPVGYRINRGFYGVKCEFKWYSRNENPVKHIVLEVISEHDDAVGEFDGRIGTGYIAKGSDGYLYGFNYPDINQGFGNTPWVRYISDKGFANLSEEEKDEIIEDYIWQDITHYQCPAEAKFVEPLDFISYCEFHQHHYYIRKGCSRCKLSNGKKLNSVTMNMKEHAWEGWY